MAASGIDAEVYQRDDDQWGWRIRARNGEIVAVDGGQGFRDRTDAERSVTRFVGMMHDALATQSVSYTTVVQ